MTQREWTIKQIHDLAAASRELGGACSLTIADCLDAFAAQTETLAHLLTDCETFNQRYPHMLPNSLLALLDVRRET